MEERGKKKGTVIFKSYKRTANLVDFYLSVWIIGRDNSSWTADGKHINAPFGGEIRIYTDFTQYIHTHP